MASRNETIRVLTEGLRLEKLAEVNCDKMLASLAVNGFTADAAKIRNDEIRHFQLVSKLISMLKGRRRGRVRRLLELFLRPGP
jgi:hypothetical protein